MTSTTPSNPWLQTANSTFARPARTPLLPSHQQTPRSVPRQGFGEPNSVPASLSTVAEPVAKRHKLNDESPGSQPEPQVHLAASFDLAKTTSTPAEQTSRNPLREGGGPQANRNLSDDKTRPKSIAPRLLPARPEKNTWEPGRDGISTSAARRIIQRGVVQTKPYGPEPPASAPRLKMNGKWILV